MAKPRMALPNNLAFESALPEFLEALDSSGMRGRYHLDELENAFAFWRANRPLLAESALTEGLSTLALRIRFRGNTF